MFGCSTPTSRARTRYLCFGVRIRFRVLFSFSSSRIDTIYFIERPCIDLGSSAYPSLPRSLCVSKPYVASSRRRRVIYLWLSGSFLRTNRGYRHVQIVTPLKTNSRVFHMLGAGFRSGGVVICLLLTGAGSALSWTLSQPVLDRYCYTFSRH